MTAFVPKNAAPRDIRELYHWTHKQIKGAGEAAEGKVTANAPSSASDTGEAGTLAFDDDYIYVCVSTDTWKRVGISTW